jgi:hypothetical protein
MMSEDIFDEIEPFEEELIEEAAKWGFIIEDDCGRNGIHWDFNYVQGRGASFDGSCDVRVFINKYCVENEDEEYRSVYNAICDDFIQEELGILTNHWNNHYCHEKTRYMDYWNYIDEDGYLETADADKDIISKTDVLRDIIESKRLELCLDFIRKVDEMLSTKMEEDTIDELDRC